ncbi:hypothetical protein A2U01_0053100 [Trifolium medium]|uniref:Uncharacterized protein n=1 Tax=Trifolium medium TaxID=97028 RepID=A0A392R5J7_9FABA|nr:hypothetical protein [Trifolium medium]
MDRREQEQKDQQEQKQEDKREKRMVNFEEAAILIVALFIAAKGITLLNNPPGFAAWWTARGGITT